MAKKNQEIAPPAISTIPLADQESPLVIDLPDGQKLVVGNIAQGTVIEVATWRGTGRPDSRTSRLMLGVSSASASTSQVGTTQDSDTSSATEPAKQNPIKNFLSSLIAKTPQRKREKEVKEIDRILKEDNEGKDFKRTESDVVKTPSRISKALDDSDDIQTWLDDLMSGTHSEFSVGQATDAKVAKVKRISSPQSKAKKRVSAKKTANPSRPSAPRSRKINKGSAKKSKKR